MKKDNIMVTKTKDIVIAVDFDGVLSKYERPWDYDDLGKPNYKMINVLRSFKDYGYEGKKVKILIFTGRQCNPKLEKWLNKYHVPYDAINYDIYRLIYKNRIKPYWNVYIGDKAVNYHWKHNNMEAKTLIQEIKEKIKWSQEGKNEV